MKLILDWVISAAVILILAYLIPGVFVENFLIAIVVAIVLGLINSFVRPIVILLTLPINIVTLGLFTLVINTLMVLLAVWIVPGFSISGFWWAFVFSIALWLVNVFFKRQGYKKESPEIQN